MSKFQFQDVSVRSIAKILANAENLERSLMQAAFNAIHHIAKHGDTTPLAWLVAKSPKAYRNRLKTVVEALSGITFGTNAKHATGLSVKGGKRGMILPESFHEFADGFAASPFGISHPRVDNGPIKAMRERKKAVADAKRAAELKAPAPVLDAEKQERQHVPGTTAKKVDPAPVSVPAPDMESAQLQAIADVVMQPDAAIVALFSEMDLVQQGAILRQLQSIHREAVEALAPAAVEAA